MRHIDAHADDDTRRPAGSISPSSRMPASLAPSSSASFGHFSARRDARSGESAASPRPGPRPPRNRSAEVRWLAGCGKRKRGIEIAGRRNPAPLMASAPGFLLVRDDPEPVGTRGVPLSRPNWWSRSPAHGGARSRAPRDWDQASAPLRTATSPQAGRRSSAGPRQSRRGSRSRREPHHGLEFDGHGLESRAGSSKYITLMIAGNNRPRPRSSRYRSPPG